MKKIICDTNIWYGIGNGSISMQAFENCTFFATFPSIYELTTSPKMLHKPMAVEKALRAISQGASNGYVKIIPYTPIEYIAHIDGNTNINKQSDNVRNAILCFGELIGSGQYKISDLNKEEIEEEVRKRIQPLIDLSNDINKDIAYNYEFLRINNLIKNKKFRNTDFSQSIKEVVKEVLIAEPIKHPISDGFNWNIIELFISVYESFYKEKILNQELIEDNDWFDLYNLAYVKPDMLYWTLDDRWKGNPNGFIHKAKMEKYLFQ